MKSNATVVRQTRGGPGNNHIPQCRYEVCEARSLGCRVPWATLLTSDCGVKSDENIIPVCFPSLPVLPLPSSLCSPHTTLIHMATRWRENQQASFALARNFSPPVFVINQGCERRHSDGGISRGADEISGAHLAALYGDLLGWDKQQASHHSQPNRLPSCMCLFLLHCHDHWHCQGWSSPRRPALWWWMPSPALWIITFY
ncbi:hypothetical protein GOODEAATRI_008657 [Goodea atripinnis]|uniref:Uncharacterized protein n=1 Tax=Goodea atripinnis TaxID=208336 RepID=A0ABV0N910_9TELE